MRFLGEEGRGPYKLRTGLGLFKHSTPQASLAWPTVKSLGKNETETGQFSFLAAIAKLSVNSMSHSGLSAPYHHPCPHFATRVRLLRSSLSNERLERRKGWCFWRCSVGHLFLFRGVRRPQNIVDLVKSFGEQCRPAL